MAVTSDDVSGEALPFSHAREITIGGAAALAQRIGFVGELGFELYVAPEWAVQIWDRLVAAGREHGVRPGGYRVLESLRIEKGYRYYGTDLTASDTPHEGGVGFCVARDKDFIGAAALAAATPRHRLRTLVLGGDGYRCVYGGEAVRIDGTIVGRVRTAAHAFTLNRMALLATVPPEIAIGTSVSVDVLGEPVDASVAPDVLYDPHNERIRD
jgi:glycine cleavage system aminomethyltransferase T